WTAICAGLTIPTLLTPETRSVEFRAPRHGARVDGEPVRDVYPQVSGLRWFRARGPRSGRV
ncbi:MAG: hypothetical protein LBD97_04680, partial [Bifidobacteriaceae bacterium]|nr:hypothetical protein [Bifidobacteriaceae bacterium]